MPSPLFEENNNNNNNISNNNIYQFNKYNPDIIPYIDRTYSPNELKNRKYKPTIPKSPNFDRYKRKITEEEMELINIYKLYSDPISIALRNSIKPPKEKKKYIKTPRKVNYFYV